MHNEFWVSRSKKRGIESVDKTSIVLFIFISIFVNKSLDENSQKPSRRYSQQHLRRILRVCLTSFFNVANFERAARFSRVKRRIKRQTLQQPGDRVCNKDGDKCTINIRE